MPADTQDASRTDDPVAIARPRTSRLRRPLVWIGLLVLLCALCGYGAYWWTTARFLQSTNDARLDADSVAAAPRVSGYVSAVLVADNQPVRAGQPLIRIDAANYRATLTQQQAASQSRQADVRVAQAQMRQQQADADQAEARLAGDRADSRFAAAQVARYRGLAATGAETAETLARMVDQRDKADAALKADTVAAVAARRRVETAQAQIVQAQAQLAASGTAIDAARLDVDNTVVRAPIDGTIGDRSVQVGQFVQPGTRLLSVVPLRQIYVVANFKETQLGRMHVGQHATVSVDALDGRRLDAVIQSMAPGTGAEFALLPPENATGNFTKIVQRVPVRLQLHTDADTLSRLVPGLSVTVEVDTRRSGAGG